MSLAVALSLATACAPPPEEITEVDVYAVVLDDVCNAAGDPVFVSDVADGAGTLETSLEYLQSQSALVSAGLFADFSQRRSTRHSLPELAGVDGRCSFRSKSELETYRDTSSVMQARGRRLPDVTTLPSASVLTLSPVGFDPQRGLALVEQFWGGGYGLCMGEFLVLRNDDDSWVIVDRIGHIMC